jgi:hypothetical protein
MKKKVSSRTLKQRALRHGKLLRELDLAELRLLFRSLVDQSKVSKFEKLLDHSVVESVFELAELGQNVQRTTNKEAQLLSCHFLRDVLGRIEREIKFS